MHFSESKIESSVVACFIACGQQLKTDKSQDYVPALTAIAAV